MRLLAATAFLSLLIGVGFGQNGRATAAHPEQVRVMADQQMQEGGTFKLRGHVQVVTPSTTLYADEADYNPLTGEVDAPGHVHIDLKTMTSAQMEQFLTEAVGHAPKMSSAQMEELLQKLRESAKPFSTPESRIKP